MPPAVCAIAGAPMQPNMKITTATYWKQRLFILRLSPSNWEDGGQNGADADTARGGPNGISLSEARKNSAEFGASDLIYVGSVRTPLDSER